MSLVNDQIKKNRQDNAVQRMNQTLTDSDPGASHPVKAELPLMGEDPRKLVQKLNKEASKP